MWTYEINNAFQVVLFSFRTATSVRLWLFALKWEELDGMIAIDRDDARKTAMMIARDELLDRGLIKE